MSTDAWFKEFEREEAHRLERLDDARDLIEKFREDLAADMRSVVIAQVDAAAANLFRSMDAERSMMRRHFAIQASLALRRAAAIDADRRDVLLALCHKALSVGEVFYGDGVSVEALHDELRALVETMRGEAAP